MVFLLFYITFPLRLSKRPLEETLVKTLNTNSILISWFRIACDFSLFDGCILLVVEFTSFGEVLSRGELFLLDRLVQPLQEEEQTLTRTVICQENSLLEICLETVPRWTSKEMSKT